MDRSETHHDAGSVDELLDEVLHSVSDRTGVDLAGQSLLNLDIERLAMMIGRFAWSQRRTMSFVTKLRISARASSPAWWEISFDTSSDGATRGVSSRVLDTGAKTRSVGRVRYTGRACNVSK